MIKNLSIGIFKKLSYLFLFRKKINDAIKKNARVVRDALITAFFFCPACVLAQHPGVDSIDRLLEHAKTDTARINLLLKKLSMLGEVNLDTAIALGKQVVAASEKAGYEKGRAAALTSLTGYYSFTGQYEKARAAAREGEAIFTRLNDNKGLGMHYNAAYGIFYGMQSQYDSAALYFMKAIAIGESIKDSNLLSGAWQNIAIGYYMQANFSQAIAYQLKALRYYENGNDAGGQAKVLMNMGNTYSESGDTLRAKAAYLKTIDISRHSGNQRTELYALKNLATLMDVPGKQDSVYRISMQAADLAIKNGDRSLHASTLSLAAHALAQQAQFAAAEELGARAIALSDSAGAPYNAYQTYSGMGNILKMQAKYRSAISYFEKAFQKLKNTNFYESDIGSNYKALSECYEKTGEPVSALAAYKTYYDIIDSVRKKDNVRKITELNLNYEFDKREQKKEEEQMKKNAVKNAQQLALLIILGAALVLAAVALVAYRNKQKANTILNSQKEEIQATLTQLKSTQAQLVQSEKMASLGELTAGIAHEIQNPLNFVNNFSEVNTELIAEMREEVEKGNLQEVRMIANTIAANEEKINQHGKRADGIVKGMLQHSRNSVAIKEPTDLNTLTDEYLRLAYHGLRAKDKSFNATLKTCYDDRIGRISIIPQDIGRVLLNLLTNAFYAVVAKKAALANSPDVAYDPTVYLSTEKHEKDITIHVRDNGNGIPAKVLDKIFQPFFTTKPTGQGTGLGLSLAYDIVKAHSGTLKVETREGDFAEFVITLPV